jgi:hypothetical protein
MSSVLHVMHTFLARQKGFENIYDVCFIHNTELIPCDTSGSHTGVYEDGCVVGYCAL